MSQDSGTRKTGLGRVRTEQSFGVPLSEIRAQNHDLSINRDKEVVHEAVAHEAPQAILARFDALKAEIQQGMRELEQMIS